MQLRSAGESISDSFEVKMSLMKPNHDYHCDNDLSEASNWPLLWQEGCAAPAEAKFGVDSDQSVSAYLHHRWFGVCNMLESTPDVVRSGSSLCFAQALGSGKPDDLYYFNHGRETM